MYHLWYPNHQHITWIRSKVTSLNSWCSWFWSKSCIFLDRRCSTLCSQKLSIGLFTEKVHLPLACSLLCWSILQPWRWRRYVPPKRRVPLNALHGVISQKKILFKAVCVLNFEAKRRVFYFHFTGFLSVHIISVNRNVRTVCFIDE
jgi:hypothetical protein